MSVKISALEALNTAMYKLAQEPLPRKTLSAEDLQRLSADIESQVPISGPEQAASVVPEDQGRSEVLEVLQGSPEQRSQSRKGALKGALVGGVTGAAGAGLAGGLSDAPRGLFMAIPGAMAGYQRGASKGRQEALLRALQQRRDPEGIERPDLY